MRASHTLVLLLWLLRASITWEDGPWLGREMDLISLDLSFPESHETRDTCEESLDAWVTKTLYYWRWAQAEILDRGTVDTMGRTRLSVREVQAWGPGRGVIHFWCVPDNVS